MRLEGGSRLGPYEISGPIGAGGMGEVYRARDTRLGREVAIKVLPQELTRDPERLARFEREARSASALNHHNIVTIHDFTTADLEAWLVMELVRGESLRDIVSRGPVPLKKLLSIATGIGDGLAAAHAAGIVHRDLKPENVMVSSDGTAKILDFGLVKNAAMTDLTDSPTDLQVSRAGVTLGTAGYMSPEQARGEPVDFRTDQFSLGLMLYEMATGKHPFRRPTPFETLTAIVNDEPEPLDDSFPEPFVWIVERCLEKNPAERYGSTADLARDLARLRERADRHAVSLRRSARPSWWIVGLLAAVILAALSIVVAIAGWRRRLPAVAEPLQVSVTAPPNAEVGFGEVTVPVMISPDARYVTIRSTGADGTEQLWLHDLRSRSQRLIAERAFSAGWSPDSRSIAYFADGKLKIVPVEGGPPHIVCDARPEGMPSWRGDTILYSQFSKDPGIYRVSAGGGTPQRIVAPDNSRQQGAVQWPQFLPDGKRFLYLTLIQGPDRDEIPHELFLGSLDGTPPRRIAAIDSRAVYVDGHLLFVRDGTLLAQPFDPDKARLTGEARPLLDDVHYFRSTGLAAFSASDNGVLAWRLTRAPSRLVWLDRAGVETGSVATAALGWGGRLSPDGNSYAAGVIDPKQGIADIWVYDLTRGSDERLTFALLDEKAPVWAADGRTIYFRSDGGGGPPDIFRLTLGEERKTLVYSGPGVNEPHDVSPDGRWLLFIDYVEYSGADVKVLPLTPAGSPRPLVATPFNELSPRFSPDGRWVAYTSDLSGRPEVYVRPFEGSATSTRISKDGGTRPRWGRDGKELFFLGPGGRLMTVPVGAGFGNPRMLFQAADAVDYEPAPNGSRFLVQLAERSTDPAVHLLINWPARLAN